MASTDLRFGFEVFLVCEDDAHDDEVGDVVVYEGAVVLNGGGAGAGDVAAVNGGVVPLDGCRPKSLSHLRDHFSE